MEEEGGGAEVNVFRVRGLLGSTCVRGEEIRTLLSGR